VPTRAAHEQALTTINDIGGLGLLKDWLIRRSGAFGRAAKSPDVRRFADDDPRGFLSQFPDGAMLDEIQRCPPLFSFLRPNRNIVRLR